MTSKGYQSVSSRQAGYLHLQKEQAPLLGKGVKQESSCATTCGCAIFGSLCCLCINIVVCGLIGLCAIIQVLPPGCDNPGCQLNATLVPKCAFILNLSDNGIPTNYYESITVRVNDANDYTGTIGLAIQQTDIAECIDVSLKMETTFKKDREFIRFWNYKTNANGKITCEDPNSSSDLIAVVWPFPEYYRYNCMQGIDINELYNNIFPDGDDEGGNDFPVIFTSNDDQIRVSVDITECLPIPHDTDGYYKEIQLNESVTFQLGSYFSEKYPETQSRLVVNSLGMQSLDGNYNPVMLQINPSGINIGRLVFISIPAPLFLCNIIPILFCICGFCCKTKQGK